MSDTTSPLRVLFLCTHNSARSQIAEALLQRRGQGRFRPASAGSDPASGVHPLALRALWRTGIDWSGHSPKSFDAVLRDGQSWDLVITVCDKAREACPSLSGRPVAAHWGILDPTAVVGTDEVRDAAFWDALTFLSRRIDLLCALPDEKVRGLALRTSLATIERSVPTPDTVEGAK